MDLKTTQHDDHSYRSFLFGFFGATAILMLCCSLVNLAADPYGSWQAGLFEIGYDPFASRIGRGESIERFKGHTVFIGNSRTRMGLNPTAPGVPHPPALNLGISGASWSELAAITRTALTRPNVKEIVLSIDYDVFCSRSEGKGGFDNSRFNPLQNGFQYHCNLLFNARCLGDSLEKLIAVASGTTPTYSRHGFELPDQNRQQQEFDPAYSEKLLRRLGQHKSPAPVSEYVPERVEELGQLISDCLVREIQLKILLHPLHADYMEISWACGQADDYKAWLVDLAQTVASASHGEVPLWDFCGWFPQSCEPILSREDRAPMRWYFEPSHYTSALGDRMLARVYAHQASDDSFGLLLTPATVAGGIARLEQRRTNWLNACKQEADCVRRFVSTKAAADEFPAHH